MRSSVHLFGDIARFIIISTYGKPVISDMAAFKRSGNVILVKSMQFI